MMFLINWVSHVATLFQKIFINLLKMCFIFFIFTNFDSYFMFLYILKMF